MYLKEDYLTKFMWNQSNLKTEENSEEVWIKWFDRIFLGILNQKIMSNQSNHFIISARWQYMFLYENRKNYVKSLQITYCVKPMQYMFLWEDNLVWQKNYVWSQ